MLFGSLVVYACLCSCVRVGLPLCTQVFNATQTKELQPCNLQTTRRSVCLAVLMKITPN